MTFTHIVGQIQNIKDERHVQFQNSETANPTSPKVLHLLTIMYIYNQP